MPRITCVSFGWNATAGRGDGGRRPAWKKSTISSRTTFSLRSLWRSLPRWTATWIELVTCLSQFSTLKKLHASEAIALFTAQVQIAIKRREFDSAEQSLALLAQIAGEDDPKVARLRRLIDTASRGRGLRRLLS